MFKPVVLFFLAIAAASAQPKTAAPRIWNDRDLAQWATPIAALNVPPGHLSEKEFYAAPVAEWVRTYPVYFPGREPVGYWQQMQNRKPEPLLAPGPRTESEWVLAGKRAFEEMDFPAFRTYDPKTIALIRSEEEYRKLGRHPQNDGTVLPWRWAPTEKGLALTVTDCAACHLRVMPDGGMLYGAQGNDPGDRLLRTLIPLFNASFFPGDSTNMALWRTYGVPWIPADIHESFKTMKPADLGGIFASLQEGQSPVPTGAPIIRRPSST